MSDSYPLGVITVSYNTCQLLRKCLRTLLSVAGEGPLDILVVDNASTDDSAQMVRTEFPDVRLIAMDRNLGFAPSNNRAMSEMSCSEVLFLNPDAIVNPGAIREMRKTLAAHPRAAVVGAQLVSENGNLQPSSFAFPSLWREFWNFLPELKGILRVRDLASGVSRFVPQLWRGSYRAVSEAHQVDSIGGACMLVRTDAFRQVGGFSDRFFLYHEEMELCYRLRQHDWEVWLEPRARVVHYEAQASGVRRFRLPPMPILGYRIEGMDYFWATHHPGVPYAVWRLMARSLLGLRAVLLRGAGCVAGRTVRKRLWDRAKEIRGITRELKGKKRGLDS
jgi:hypothetical protein